ncbi:serine hydrolase domain-containing protein [Stenotrophomonas sp. 24(2023)]|uniref:serine hydrolase domain-containing protein n=1 Tax=Stenotrophomonas sp. 24(2023) TaxID=3068324 RepID=UPI0027DF9391|nr:serine hydrolase domain-containing protein [Stenotrophomonas sp. 24(2023)]WMJ69226.1 serine hydrolase domain-containing protein [Stenotrophomonas sp. 24(2023)]
MALIACGSAAGAAPGALATAPVAPLDAATAQRIDAQVQQVMQRFAVPGAALAVIQDGQQVYARAYGLRDRERRLPVRTDTPFEIGSITKQFTAAAIVQLQEAGKLKLDDTLATYVPDAPHAGAVTLRQLLSHTSGLHEYFDGPEQEVDQRITQPASYAEIIARIADRPLDFAPGSRWSYSNTGYLLLGKVIETVSGQSYRAYVQQHLLDPLGMRHTFTLADKNRLSGMAVGYRHEAGALKRSPYFHPDWSGPAGFLVSTLDDLARWDAGLSGGTIVSSAGYADMTTSVSIADGKPADYGLGLFVNTVYGQPRIGHTGGSQGFTTADEYFPAQKLRIIAFTNLGDKSPEPGITLTNAVFAALQPQQVAAWEQPVAGERADVTANARASFQQLQAGAGYGAFSASLGQRLAAGLGAGLSRSLRGYGAPTRMVFKGDRQGERGTLHDYVAEFGPGVLMPYTVRVDEDGKVVAFALD